MATEFTIIKTHFNIFLYAGLKRYGCGIIMSRIKSMLLYKTPDKSNTNPPFNTCEKIAGVMPGKYAVLKR